jgi:uncharacterized phage protein (TIGR01671 family)
MKTVKFRIWNGIEMVYDITTGKYGTFYVNPEKGDGLNPQDTASLTVNTTKYPEGIPLMQYTGIEDKNGKEIYEGDIVRFKYWSDSYQKYKDKVMKVEYLKGFFCPLVSFGDEPSSKDFEVIGDIYKTPELLQKGI